MFQSKENTIGRGLLPLCMLCTIIVAAYNVWLSERISTLGEVVQKQGEKIVSLERICASKRKRGNEGVFNKLESKILSNKRNEFKVHRAAASSENSKVNRIGLSSENRTASISFDKKVVKDDQHSTQQNEPQLPTHDILNGFAFETVNHHKIVKRSPRGKVGRNSDRRERKRERCRKQCKGRRGRKGERGPQGPQGQPGPKGNHGPSGSMGPMGYPGPRGPTGPKGDSGITGKAGPAGRHGFPGVKGEKGEIGNKGDRGEDGKPGPKGDKGQDGNAKTTELIHLVGNEHKKSTVIDLSGFAAAKDARFTNWVLGEKHGQIRYSDGYIHIKVTGFYYVYCQIHYSGRISYNRHQVYKNNKDPLLLGFDTFNRGRGVFSSHASTKFVGGVFRLTENDSLTVRGAATQYTFMKESSYFGVYLIHALS